jgi:hypothetical protein
MVWGFRDDLATQALQPALKLHTHRAFNITSADSLGVAYSLSLIAVLMAGATKSWRVCVAGALLQQL